MVAVCHKSAHKMSVSNLRAPDTLALSALAPYADFLSFFARFGLLWRRYFIKSSAVTFFPRRWFESQNSSDALDSPLARPSNRPRKLMSSSKSGQWIPNPPILKFCRSRDVPCNKRGYHDNGTESVRPSSKSTINSELVTRAALACTSSSDSRSEVVIPCSHQQCSISRQYSLDVR